MEKKFGYGVVVMSVLLAIIGFWSCIVCGTSNFIFSLFEEPNLIGFIIDIAKGAIFITVSIIGIPVGMGMIHSEDSERDEIE